ncbi:MAG: glycine zipper 2TM domain-containing protein [Novosphingobium sp.]
MHKTIIALTLAAAMPVLPAAAATNLQATASAQPWAPQTVQQYRYDRYRGDYYGGRYWDRSNKRYYAERRMGRNDRIWERDGRYYCRRNDGTTGLVVGAALGGVLGNSVAGRGDRTLGTILGIAGGGLLGREIDRGGVRCR